MGLCFGFRVSDLCYLVELPAPPPRKERHPSRWRRDPQAVWTGFSFCLKLVNKDPEKTSGGNDYFRSDPRHKICQSQILVRLGQHPVQPARSEHDCHCVRGLCGAPPHGARARCPPKTIERLQDGTVCPGIAEAASTGAQPHRFQPCSQSCRARTAGSPGHQDSGSS